MNTTAPLPLSSSDTLSAPIGSMRAQLQRVNPRHSLMASLIWLVIALAASFALAASIWVGGVAREIVVQQHIRRLVLETDQLGSDLGQAVSARLTAVHAAGMAANAVRAFEYLTAVYPEQTWTTLAAPDGTVIAGDGRIPIGGSVREQGWFTSALSQPWIGMINARASEAPTHVLGDFSVAIKEPSGRVLGVVAGRLSSPWAAHDVARLRAGLDFRGTAQRLVLDGAGNVRIGPAALLNRRWHMAADNDAPRFEQLPDGERVLVARSPLLLGGRTSVDAAATRGWRVQLSEPQAQVSERANALAERIVWISICLGGLTALAGALGARHLTNRLRRLTRSAVAVGRDEFARIEVPPGQDEVAKLAAAFAQVLDNLRRERRELLAFSGDLERRVDARTREIERLAEESRYAAIVRERLKIARDLHDTLAHSMMAMLSEVRLLRKLQVVDPASLVDELARAEVVAHDGLNAARTAITQMRVNAVRDTGLAAALGTAFDRFVDHTGLSGRFTADPEAARFGDERAETLFRMAEEVLRNIERHAIATRVTVDLAIIDGTHLSLRIADDGVGFDAHAERPGHYGLTGLREQAHLIGATLNIASAPTRGTQVTVSLRIVPELN